MPGQASSLQPMASFGLLEGAKIRGRWCVRASNEFEPLCASDTRIRAVRASCGGYLGGLRGMEGQAQVACDDGGHAAGRSNKYYAEPLTTFGVFVLSFFLLLT